MDNDRAVSLTFALLVYISTIISQVLHASLADTMFLNLIAGHIAFAVNHQRRHETLSCLIVNMLFSSSQQQLNKIKAWKEKVLSMTKSFCTENGIFFVDCHDVQQKLLPQLNSIYKKMVQMVALDVIRLSDEMVTDVDELSQVKTRLDNY